MGTKHTPGPWLTDESDHDAPYQDIKIKAVKHHTVCTIWIDDAPVHDFNAAQKANARLIAASPDLLEALQAAVKFWDSITELDSVNNIHIQARAAIAKATGETS